MWVFTKYGFVSVACARKEDGTIDEDTVMVRARSRQHLVNLKKRFPDTELGKAKIRASAATDYEYRAVVPKDVWASILSELAMEQTWSNFKNEADRFAIQKTMPHGYVDALHEIWSVMRRFGLRKGNRERSTVI
jgi:hypothetical protein